MNRTTAGIVIAAALALLLLSWVLFPTPGLRMGGKGLQNKALMYALSAAIRSYKTDYGQGLAGDNRTVYRTLRGENPRGIVYIEFKKEYVAAHDELTDPWGAPYRMIPGGDGIAAIRSDGPDGKPGTEDDIVVTLQPVN